MRLNEIVVIGEIFEIKNKSLCVRTKLQDVPEGNQLVVLQPTVKGIPVRAEEDTLFEFAFYRPTGLYTFLARMKESFKEDGIMLCRFVAVSDVRKIQRRQCYRLPIVLNAAIRETDDEGAEKQYKGKTINLSEKSVQLSCFTRFSEGTHVDVAICLSETETMTLQAKVLKCRKPAKKTEPYDILLLFQNYTEKDRTHISRYVLKQQIVARKRKAKSGNYSGLGEE
ncbi:MAG: PilZ domain-containing protein [Eubacteriales bacterium]|nr:PilZ domain-containing protein [Eubacteriales bacterium]